jgi:hypothetical protein
MNSATVRGPVLRMRSRINGSRGEVMRPGRR